MLIAFDTETHLIQPGMLAPKFVCLSYADELGSGLLLGREAMLFFLDRIDSESVTFVGHNAAYDLGVLVAETPGLLPCVFRALEAGRIRDTMIRGQLIDIARGEYTRRRHEGGKSIHAGHSLAAMAQLYLGRTLQKTDTFRLRYNELDGVPLDQWPEEAKTYAIQDAVTTLDVYHAQDASVASDGRFPGYIPNELEQTKAAWVLHLMACYGVRTDGAAVAALKERLTQQLAGSHEFLRAEGLVKASGTKKNPTWSKDMAAIRARVEAAHVARGLEIPRTKTGQVATDEDAKLASGDPVLVKMAAFSGAEKILSTYIPSLEKGTSIPINARWNTLLESGRTSCSNPNLQNPPASDSSVRECFVPRKGFVYAGADYSVIELRALAQICLDLFGSSKLADAFRAGEDPHDNFARSVGLDPKGEIEINGSMVSVRKYAKICNFGFPGGLGAERFVQHAGGYGIQLTLAEAQKIRNDWFAAWPEVLKYFEYIGRQTQGGEGTITQIRSGRIRGGCRFSQACNTHFQGLVSDGAKEALWLISREAYTDAVSPLFGSRPVLFLHDEIIAEVPEAYASEAVKRMIELMLKGMQKVLPDVPIRVSEPVLMRRWSKAAKSQLINGKWTVWE